MKKLFYTFLTASALFLAGCFETTEEVTIKEDGSGTFVTTNDMSAVVAIAKQMGGKDAEKMEDTVMDTTMSLASEVDSIESLSAEEKELMKKGTMRMNINLKENKVLFTLNFPFSRFADISKFGKLTTKIMGKAMGDKLGDGAVPMGDMPEPTSFDDYYDISYSDGLIEKKLNKVKYSGVEHDTYLKGMKEAGSMGIPVTSTQVINLPRPAKEVDGKNIKLSDDKRKVTVKADIDDFFDEPKKLEFRIEY